MLYPNHVSSGTSKLLVASKYGNCLALGVNFSLFKFDPSPSFLLKHSYLRFPSRYTQLSDQLHPHNSTLNLVPSSLQE
ncbi:hypothetical protein L2E82_39312 [Cichorium intybus]|uniref:Uncharacterized protein n=1 Tax=Cichorium intybus TaxID=13427 RepID=A0ACB9AHM5_CICIN|nr:hypothetical protein L2E82_39312 [Cichorium intybus]